MRGMKRFKVKGKLSPRYINTFKILERKGQVAYQLELGMAILPAGSDIHGYPTRRFRVRVRNLTRGSHPYPTRDKIESGTGFIFYPRVRADIRNYFQFSLFIPPETGRPNVHLYSIIQNPSPLTSRSHARSHHSPSHRSRSLTVSLSASHPSHHQPP
jgi:hypothetical protein